MVECEYSIFKYYFWSNIFYFIRGNCFFMYLSVCDGRYDLKSIVEIFDCCNDFGSICGSFFFNVWMCYYINCKKVYLKGVIILCRYCYFIECIYYEFSCFFIYCICVFKKWLCCICMFWDNNFSCFIYRFNCVLLLLWKKCFKRYRGFSLNK